MSNEELYATPEPAMEKARQPALDAATYANKL